MRAVYVPISVETIAQRGPSDGGLARSWAQRRRERHKCLEQRCMQRQSSRSIDHQLQPRTRTCRVTVSPASLQGGAQDSKSTWFEGARENQGKAKLGATCGRGSGFGLRLLALRSRHFSPQLPIMRWPSPLVPGHNGSRCTSGTSAATVRARHCVVLTFSPVAEPRSDARGMAALAEIRLQHGHGVCGVVLNLRSLQFAIQVFRCPALHLRATVR